jgi:hypothetical protein
MAEKIAEDLFDQDIEVAIASAQSICEVCEVRREINSVFRIM